MTSLALAVLPWQVGRARGLEAWAERLDAELAAVSGAEMAVMPEYAGLELAAGDTPDLAAELAHACELAPAALAIAQDAARRHGIWLVPGSMPWRIAGAVHNRAPLIAPDGRVAFQDKRIMTRFEAELWGVSPGNAPCVFDTPWGRIGIAICYDLEFPALTRAQVEAGAWLILAPSCTDTLAGWNRVRIAARARAMENQCFVALAPTTGIAPWIATLDENRGAAGVYGPMDRGFPDDGVIAEGPEGSGAALIVELDPARLDAVRQDGAVFNHRDHPASPPKARLAVFS
jgi:predicted amidohydrolase